MSESSILKPVDLTDLCYICTTYAMRRVGIPANYFDHFVNITPDYYKNSSFLCVGDILVWDNEDASHNTPAILIENNLPISKFVKFDKHYSVYEGNGIVSDTQLIGDSQIPNIRFQYLVVLRRKPDGVIPYSVIAKTFL